MHAMPPLDKLIRIALTLVSLPAQHVTVGIVGGSDLVKISEQLNADKSAHAVAAASPHHLADRPTARQMLPTADRTLSPTLPTSACAIAAQPSGRMITSSRRMGWWRTRTASCWRSRA